MRAFQHHRGLVLPFDRVNVDTDQMVPKQFLKLQTREGYGRVLFYDWRYLSGEQPNPDFILNQPRYQGASIMLTRQNFGCGSSREHAAWAVAEYGFRVLIGPSFGDIFFGNCLPNGILAITLPDPQIDELFRRAEANSGYTLHVDLPSQTIRDDLGLELNFEIDDFRKQSLLKGLDEIGYTFESENAIREYERAHHPEVEQHSPVDFTYPEAS